MYQSPKKREKKAESEDKKATVMSDLDAFFGEIKKPAAPKADSMKDEAKNDEESEQKDEEYEYEYVDE